MRPHYSITARAQSEPLTLDQATEHCRIDSTDDLSFLNALIPVAREYVDGVTGRVSLQTEFRLTAPTWESICHQMRGEISRFHLDRSPLVSVESIKYYDETTETLTTMSAADYLVVTDSDRGIVQINIDLPMLMDRPDAIQINFTAGYDSSCETPPILAHAQKMLVAHLFENRIAVDASNVSNEVPYGLKAMIENQKTGGWVV